MNLGDMVLQFIPITVLQLVVGVVMFNLAKKLRMNKWLIFVLICLPVVGVFALWIYLYRVLFVVADRLVALENRLDP